MRAGRSIVFYASIGLAMQAVLLAMLVVFVVAGVSYRDSAVKALHGGAQAMQIANLNARSTFLDAQRALQGYQATRQGRFLQTFYDDQDAFVLVLSQLRQLAWPAVLANVSAQARTALTAFEAGDHAVPARAGSRQSAQLYSRASASSDTFAGLNYRLGKQLAAASDAFAAASGRTLGMGLAGTTAVLAIGVMLPVILGALALGWLSAPLHELTQMVRGRALGDFDVRAAPAGPADVRELTASVNFLADESDRLTVIERERSRLQTEMHQASTRIREHLRADDILREAVSAIQQHLSVDSVWVGLAREGLLAFAEGDRSTRERATSIAAVLPDDSVEWMTDLYQRHEIYCVQHLSLDQPQKIPRNILSMLLDLDAASLALAPFGAGAEFLGVVSLLRKNLDKPWTGPEISAVESLAADIGRALEHARLYESKEQLVKELRSLDRAKTSFLASSSHDLRTPLTSIVGFIELLTDGEAGPVPPLQAQMHDAISRNARRLQTLISDMLTISKIELGSFTSHMRPVDLTALVPPAAEVLSTSAADKGLILEIDCPGHSLIVDGDAEQLDRVVVNLLSNAVKYTPRGGTVRLTAGRDGQFARLTVADTGIGIPEHDQRSVFTRFFRASNAVAQQIQGSGLGLSIVQTVVANHQGDVVLESQEGGGTTVVVTIPLLASPGRAGGPAR